MLKLYVCVKEIREPMGFAADLFAPLPIRYTVGMVVSLSVLTEEDKLHFKPLIDPHTGNQAYYLMGEH